MDASSGISSNLYDASTTAQYGVGQSPAEAASAAGAAGGMGAAGAGGAAASGSSQHISQVATMQSTVNSLIAGGEGTTSQLMKMAVALLILDMLLGNDSQKSGGSDPMELLTAAMLGQALGGAAGGAAAGGGTQTLMSFSSTSEVSVTQTTSAGSAQQAYAGDPSPPQAAPMVNMIA